ncbi:MAG TPA: hypothetical protein VFL57_07540 [Bryobacteraceae bacterium]|nr:hypothetical protein [Bryobacteraceae bacterium]
MTNTLEQNNQPGSDKLVFPDLLWAAVIFLALNILLVLWFTLSPRISLGAGRAAQEESVAVADKPSPFTPVVDERRVSRKTAEKMKPVIVATLDSLDHTSASSWTTLSRQSETASNTESRGYLRGDAVYGLMDRETQMPRLTAANYPRRTEPTEPPVRHVATQPVVP